MKYVSILLTTGAFLLSGSLARAEEGDKGSMPGTLTLSPTATATPIPVAAAPCCAAAGWASCDHGHCDRLWDWLCYRRPSARCECGHAPSHCIPPLYTWFLDRCACGGCAATACAGGACGAHVPPVGAVRPVATELPTAAPSLKPADWP
jgi:hypothetical protein